MAGDCCVMFLVTAQVLKHPTYALDCLAEELCRAAAVTRNELGVSLTGHCGIGVVVIGDASVPEIRRAALKP